MAWDYFEFVIILLMLSVLFITVLQRFKFPSVLSYLLIGVLVGTQAFPWGTDPDEMHLVAELGVVFLLFTIGLEISFSNLWSMRHTVIILGSMQVVFCTLIPCVVAYLVGFDLVSAFIASSALSLSSTAIVVKQLKEQGHLFQPQGQLSFGLLIFQDIAAIPFLIIIPLLANANEQALAPVLGIGLIKGITLVGILYVLLKYLSKPLFNSIAKQSSQELFMLFVLLIVTGAAWLTHYFNLSMAFGAFVAGAILSETEFRHQLEVDILPFRDILLGLFFITIGMRLNLMALAQYWPWIILLTTAILLFKSSLIMLITRCFGGVASRTALQSGLILAHGGEFGFALLAISMNNQTLPDHYGQIILSAIILSMLLATVFIRHHQVLSNLLIKQPSTEPVNNHSPKIIPGMKDHVIILGYGRVGQSIGRFLSLEKQPFIALDLDASRVSEAALAGEPVYYGDAFNQRLLEAVNLSQSKLIIFSFKSEKLEESSLNAIKKLNPDIPILMRTHDDTTIETWLNRGVTEVIPETQELSLVLAAHALLLIGTQPEVVNHHMTAVRKQHYQFLRAYYSGETDSLFGLQQTSQMVLRAIPISSDSNLVGHTLSEILNNTQDINVWSVKSDDKQYVLPEHDYCLKENDVMVIQGPVQALNEFELVLLNWT